MERLRAQRERHRGRHALVRVGTALAGFLLVVLGVILIPLPGPGLIVVAVGLFLLALEFTWAERLLLRTLARTERAREAASASRLRKALSAGLLLAATAAAVAIARIWDIPLLPV